ncbi:sugar phosphate isomerase/epimerase family protein [Nonomuraea sediminis]|uniref:sugar phosphate isomerase/epimerase family protein n=1 Tax=Nonomuraea sediminis TaxID=2835864 RepID=UPI001BDD635E|nr:sugar phosphate isomerase/epimerase [Nonomuraea sediminis]
MSTQLSVQLYSVRQDFAADPGGTLTRLAGIGFRQAEPYGIVDNLQALREGLTAAGLTAPTAHQQLIGRDLEEVFEAAKVLGVTTVIDPFTQPERWSDPVEVADIAAAINAAAKAAAPHGITVGYHNHWWELKSQLGGRSALEAFADQLDPEVVLEVDTYWSTVGGADTPELLRRLGDRVRAIHVKDGDLAQDTTGQVPAGQGRVPMRDVLAASPSALRVVEFDNYDGDIYDGLSASYAYLTGEAA